MYSRFLVKRNLGSKLEFKPFAHLGPVVLTEESYPFLPKVQGQKLLIDFMNMLLATPKAPRLPKTLWAALALAYLALAITDESGLSSAHPG
jgi:hypothetical protein